MAIAQENKYTNLFGVFPNATMIDASGVGTTDGSEFAALPLNDGWEPFQQAVMNYAAAGNNQNSPSGLIGVPNGVADTAGASQILQAIQKAHGIGPGIIKLWGNADSPGTTGDRIFFLQGQGIVRATYPSLDAAVYVGDSNNATAPYFYRATDSAGTTRSTTGAYLILPSLTTTLAETAVIKDVKSSGVGGGTSTAAVWVTRDLNNISSDITGLSLSTNQITMPPGKFLINFMAPGYNVDSHKIKFFNVTDATDDIIGSTSFSGVSTVQGEATLVGIITLQTPKVFEVRHISQTTRANGFGLPGGVSTGSVSEIYTHGTITKISEIPMCITY